MENNKIKVKIKKLVPEAIIPKYAHDGDVCMDLTAVSVEYDIKNDMYIYHTGLAFESDKNIGQFLYLRSSNCKTDAYLCNGVGVADSAIYRGEIQLRMKNRTSLKQLMYNEYITNNIKTTLKKLSEQLKYNNIFSNFFNGVRSQAIEKCIENINSSSYMLIYNDEDWFKKLNYTSDYIKEIAMKLAPYEVGDRIGQMVFKQYPTVELIITDNLSDTDRGEGGFGSSGK